MTENEILVFLEEENNPDNEYICIRATKTLLGSTNGILRKKCNVIMC